MDNFIPGPPQPNLRRLLVGLHLEGKPFRHHLVHLGRRRLLCHCPFRRIHLESQVIGESLPPCGSTDTQLG
jgi:hypothetical protein